MTTSELYWISRLDNISFLFGFFWVAFTVLTVFSIIFFVHARDEEEEENYRKSTVLLVCSSVALVISIIGAVLTPTTKEMLAIKTMNYLTTDKRVTTTADKAFTLIEEYLDSKLKENKKGDHK